MLPSFSQFLRLLTIDLRHPEGMQVILHRYMNSTSSSTAWPQRHRPLPHYQARQSDDAKLRADLQQHGFSNTLPQPWKLCICCTAGGLGKIGAKQNLY